MTVRYTDSTLYLNLCTLYIIYTMSIYDMEKPMIWKVFFFIIGIFNKENIKINVNLNQIVNFHISININKISINKFLILCEKYNVFGISNSFDLCLNKIFCNALFDIGMYITFTILTSIYNYK